METFSWLGTFSLGFLAAINLFYLKGSSTRRNYRYCHLAVWLLSVFPFITFVPLWFIIFFPSVKHWSFVLCNVYFFTQYFIASLTGAAPLGWSMTKYNKSFHLYRSGHMRRWMEVKLSYLTVVSLIDWLITTYRHETLSYFSNNEQRATLSSTWKWSIYFSSILAFCLVVKRHEQQLIHCFFSFPLFFLYCRALKSSPRRIISQTKDDLLRACRIPWVM